MSLLKFCHMIQSYTMILDKSYKTFYFVLYECSKYVRVFVPARLEWLAMEKTF